MFEEKWNPITWRSNLGRSYMMDTTFLLNSQTINLWWNTFQKKLYNVSWSYLTTAFFSCLEDQNPLDIFSQMFLFKTFIFWDGLFPHACFFGEGTQINPSTPKCVREASASHCVFGCAHPPRARLRNWRPFPRFTRPNRLGNWEKTDLDLELQYKRMVLHLLYLDWKCVFQVNPYIKATSEPHPQQKVT